MSALPNGGLKAGFTWAAAGSALQILAQGLALVGFARLLSPEEFGIVSIATLVTQLAFIFAEFGVAPHVVQRPALQPETVGTAFRLSCALGAVLALINWATAPFVARLFETPELTEVLRAYSAVFLIRGWSATQEAVLHRDLDFRFLARSEGWSFGLGYAVVGLLSALMGLSYWSLVLGHIAQAIIKAVLVASRHVGVPRLPWARNAAIEMLNFGAGQTLARLGSYLGSQADSIVVATSLGVGPIGYYGRANQVVTMPTFYIGQVFDKVLFPATALIQGDLFEVSKRYRTALGVVALLSVPLATAVAVFGSEIVAVLLGPGWQPVVEPLIVLALAVPFRLLHKVSDPTSRALGATYARAWRQWLSALLVIVMTGIGVPFGLVGVAFGVVIACAVDAWLMVSLCMKMSRISPVEVIAALIPSVQFGTVTSIVLMASLWGVKMAGLGPVVNLVVGGALGAAVLAILVQKVPRALWGSRGSALIDVVFHSPRTADAEA